MVFGLEKYLKRTFDQKDLDKAEQELTAAEEYLNSFDLSRNDVDMKAVRKAGEEVKQKKLRVEEIEQALDLKS